MSTGWRFVAPTAIGASIGLLLLADPTAGVVGSLLIATALAGLAWKMTGVRTPWATTHASQATVPALRAGVESLIRAIGIRDQRGPGHTTRMQAYATGLARAMGLPEAEVESIGLAALAHDVGKLAVPPHILSRTTPLPPEEQAAVRSHAIVGAELLQPFDRHDHHDHAYPVSAAVRSHHERWDGMGYPDGLHDGAIPLGGQIVGLVEYYEALTTDRPYRDAMAPDTARDLLRQEAGHAFDPRLVARFLEIVPGLEHRLRGSTRIGGRVSDVATSTDAYDCVERAQLELQKLYEVSRAMSTSLALVDTMMAVSDQLRALVPFSCCALFVKEADTDTLRCGFAAGTDASVIQSLTLRDGQGLAGWVAQHQRPIIDGSPEVDAKAAGLAVDETFDLASALLFPLRSGERLVGVLALYHVQQGFYTAEHGRVATQIADQLAAAVTNSLRFDQAQSDSLTDALTSLPNTRSLFLHLGRELARARRGHGTLALILLDLDDFKQINDRYGHHTGDRALCDVARRLRADIRPYDTCARYAGDEFIVILSECSEDEGHRKRDEFQRDVSELEFAPQPGVRLPLSISAGAAMFPADGDSYEELLAAADRRMYEDKARRKRTTIFGDGHARQPGPRAV